MEEHGDGFYVHLSSYYALQNKLEEAQAEIEKVKAESLRIVPHGKMQDIDAVPLSVKYCTYHGGVYARSDKYGYWWPSISDENKHLLSHSLIQPVNLRRWT
jgi:hypothetical protein